MDPAYIFILWTFIIRGAFVACSPTADQSQVIGSPQPIIVAPGEDVILPCHLEPPLNVQGLTVEWSKPDLKPDPSDPLSRVGYVHLYRGRQEVVDMKIPSDSVVELVVVVKTLTTETPLDPRMQNTADSDNTTVAKGNPSLNIWILAIIFVILVFTGGGVGGYCYKKEVQKHEALPSKLLPG
ncbi:hypothetical protein Q5P01_002850 [Channa striata]|uniref:Ig-like domain-containing protein n=1 Tax=Channa striata TaxID=64152 RepID=A0AA88NNG0_CHASR|nr:hypothetical protein Q5P01_002850 [Channa striata]